MKVEGTFREQGSWRRVPFTALVLRTLKGRCGRRLTTSLGSSHLQPQGFRLYRRNAAGSQRRGRSLQQRAKETQAPASPPRQLLPAGTPAPRTSDPETLHEARGRQKRHRGQRLPPIRSEGNSLPSPPAPPRRGPAPRNGDQAGPGGGEKGGTHCGGDSDPGIQASVRLRKTGRG